MTTKTILPDNAMDSHIALLGKTGSGKTYAAKGLVERIIKDGRRVCIIDPTGAWWGLKSSASGKSAGLPVTIFGGPAARTDMPIRDAHGAALGEVVGTSPGAFLIDLSEMSVGEQHRFVEAFAASVYHHNRLPLHLVIDEADEFAPQKPMPDATRLLHNVQRIAARGRVKGFRVVMISQRPARLNKDVLTQAAALVALQLTAPQDRKAVEDWVAGQSDPKTCRGLIDGLPKLRRGQAVVWAPDFDVLAQVDVPKITTYDSSSSPDYDATTEAVVLAKVDLEALRGKLTAVEVEAKANDPKVLKARIAELEKASRHQGIKASGSDGFSRERVKEIVDQERDAVRLQAYEAARAVVSPMRPMLKQLEEYLDKACERIDKAIAARQSGRAVQVTKPQILTPKHAPKTSGSGEPRPMLGSGASPAGVKRAEVKCLQAFVWYELLGITEPTDEQLCYKLGYSPNSSTISVLLSALRRGGFVEGRSITETGRAIAGPAPELGTLDAFHAEIRSFLDGTARRVFDTCLEAHPGVLTEEDVCAANNWSVASSTLSVGTSALRRAGLMEKRGLRLTAAVFPEGLA